MHSSDPSTAAGAYMWIDVGGAMVALLFHDILLVLVIVAFISNFGLFKLYYVEFDDE